MFVKKEMVVGKLLTIVALIVSTSTEAQIIIRPPESLYQLNLGIRNLFGGLSDDEHRKHQQAVYSALNMLDNGETIKWYSDTNYTHGTVEVVSTQKLSGKVCRKIYSEVNTQRTTKHHEYMACFDGNSKTWHFFPNK